MFCKTLEIHRREAGGVAGALTAGSCCKRRLCRDDQHHLWKSREPDLWQLQSPSNWVYIRVLPRSERGAKVRSLVSACERINVAMNGQTGPTKYFTRLRNRFLVAERTMAFQFEKPSHFTFRAGQWIDITLPHPSETDAKGNVRGFSIASAPHEDLLLVATRLRDTAFKRELAKMPLNSMLQIEGPGGNLALHNNPVRTALFLAGGIGVTPIRSILFRAAKEKLPHQILFFYSNRRPEDAPFLGELTQLQRENPNYTLIATMTQMDKSCQPWTGETGHIDQAMLSKYLGAAKSPIYYVVGPPGMVSGVHALLNQTGVDDDDIRAEDFGGY